MAVRRASVTSSSIPPPPGRHLVNPLLRLPRPHSAQRPSTPRSVNGQAAANQRRGNKFDFSLKAASLRQE
ncbi:hypothetical protein E2C01_074333 [Portunus trituberculatus]|uniref:Uncharacterized protein n=1 Tax=Portunus trituberculatus TaxID=210409 RepID=A0A5B7IE13_PORTR|nr:hypothetical protein [Portunus trituberculatus]